MSFRFGIRSRLRLRGVHPDLVRVAERAITMTPIDFAITEGLRTMERQRELYRSGASKTLTSRHLTGHAIDVAAIVAGEVRWEFNLYLQIATAFREAAEACEVSVNWGGCWQRINGCHDLSRLVGDYVARCRDRGRRPLVDGPHFELPWSAYPEEADDET